MNTNTNAIKVQDRTQQILSAIFGADDAVIDEQFQTFEDRKVDTGKLYLPLHVCLKPLETLPFKVEGDVRADKVVLHY